MMTIQEKRQQLHMLMLQNHLVQAKEHVLSVYNVERIRDLSEADLDDCIARMNVIAESKENDSQIRHWRHLCLKAMSKYVDTSDWNKVNSFMLSPKIAGKHMYELSIEELKVLHRKINKIGDIMKSRDVQIKRQSLLN